MATHTQDLHPIATVNQHIWLTAVILEDDDDDDDMMSSDRGDPGLYNAGQRCEVTLWGDWSHCSTNCGTGTRTRTRDYAEIMESSSCSKELFENDSCEERSGCSQDIIGETTQGPRMK